MFGPMSGEKLKDLKSKKVCQLQKVKKCFICQKSKYFTLKNQMKKKHLFEKRKTISLKNILMFF